MKFMIRADASLHIGNGHIMRCLTLAHALRQQGHSIQFITRAHAGHLADYVMKQGFACALLPLPAQPEISGCLAHFPSNPPHAAWLGVSQAQDIHDCLPYWRDFAPDWLVVDHYALDAQWEHAAITATGAKLLAIDDLHDRPHAANVLLDQNWQHQLDGHQAWAAAGGHVLAGTRYALLRDEFAAWRTRSLARRVSGSLNHTPECVVSLGGVDKDNITFKVLNALADWHDAANSANTGSLNVRVVMGGNAPHIATVRQWAANAPFACQVLVNIENMAEILAQADWAIGAAGSSTWERCCVGLPTVMLVLADNQRTIAEQLQQVGAAVAFDVGEIGSAKWLACLPDFRQPENLQKMSANAAALCDGLGAARVVNHIMELSQNQVISTIRAAQLDDCRVVFEWRNHADIRRFMFNTDELIWENHAAWFAKQLSNPDFNMLIYLVNNQPQGYASFKRLPEKAWEWGFYTAPDCERGHGAKMARLALAWAFAELGAARIVGQVLSYNAASLRLHEKLGFCRFHSTSDGTQPEKDEVAQFELWAQEFGY